VAADATQLSQVLLNLVGNARDAARPGGTIAIGTAVEGNSVVMTVEDDGIGMSADTQAHMFEPFFTTKESTGTGLGLATVHGIVSQLGGQISVTSAEGKGSGFTVHLPRASAPQGQARLEEPSVAPQGAARILVIEDDAAVRAVVCSMLQSAGYTVSAADTADGAQRQAASGEKIDLVISDVVLSDASGPVVVSGLKRRSPQLKVLFVSGHAEGLIAQRGMLSPGTHFLAKPFTRDVLLAKVDQILKGSSTHHEIPQPLAAS
jgi:CheY-like chemotaxis protein